MDIPPLHGLTLEVIPDEEGISQTLPERLTVVTGDNTKALTILWIDRAVVSRKDAGCF